MPPKFSKFEVYGERLRVEIRKFETLKKSSRSAGGGSGGQGLRSTFKGVVRQVRSVVKQYVSIHLVQ